MLARKKANLHQTIDYKMARNLLIWIFSIAFSVLLQAQDGSPRKVLVESFFYRNDSRAEPLIDTMRLRPDKSIYIDYASALWNNGYEYNTPNVNYPNRRWESPRYTPEESWFIDGKCLTYDSITRINSWEVVTTRQIDSAAAIPSPFEIGLVHSFTTNFDTMVIEVEIECTQNVQGGDLKMWLAPVQNQVTRGYLEGNWPLIDYINYNWEVAPDTGAINLPDTWVVGQRMQFTYKWHVRYVHQINQMSIIGFIQDFQTKEIHQASQSALVNPRLSDVKIVPVTVVSNAKCELNMSFVADLRNAGVDTVREMEIELMNSLKPIKKISWRGNLLPSQSIRSVLAQDTFIGDKLNYLSYKLLTVNGRVDNSPFNNQTISYRYWYLDDQTRVDSFYQDFESVYPRGVGFEEPNYWTRMYYSYGSNFTILNSALAFNDYQYYAYDPKPFFGTYTTVGVNTRGRKVTDSISFDYACVPALGWASWGANPRIVTDSMKVDTFALQATTDCGLTWITLWQKSGRALMTTNFQDTSSLSASHWRRVKASIRPVIGNKAHFRFINLSNGMAKVLLDNINIGPPPPVPPHVYTVKPYPNPTGDIVQLDLKFDSPETRVMSSIYDRLGRQVLDTELHIQGAGFSTISRDLSTLEKGCYYLSVEYPSGFRRSWPVIKL